MFVKFDEKGRQQQVSNMLPDDDSAKDFYEIPHTIPDGSLLKLLEGKVVALSETEIEELAKVLELEALERIAVRKRDQLLEESSEFVSPDVWESYTDVQKKAVSDYRQALKDIEKQAGFPKEVSYPVLSI